MSSASEDAFRAELTAAAALLDPQIQGLKDLLTTLSIGSIKQETADAVQAQLDLNKSRRQAIQTNLDAMNTLDATGYPDNPPSLVTPDVYADIQGNLNDLTAAFGEFAPAEAVGGSIDLGTAQDNP